jgi:diphosphomevalonate decarboxylase
MKATAVAPANIAFIKYWGKKDAKLRIPYNPSISMNLSGCTTTTTVEFSDTFSKDIVIGVEPERVMEHIDRLRNLSGVKSCVRVETKNNFPIASGIASSASGFAALTVAAAAALDMNFSEKELTALARVGSGSACRSIPDGFVKWEGEFAYSLYPHDYWDIRDIVVIVEKTTKKISSSVGHESVETSPLFIKRLEVIPTRIEKIEQAFEQKNFQLLGEVVEEDCLDMHAVMQTQKQPLLYWNVMTKSIMEQVRVWRSEGLAVYFTIDAGPNLHLICEGKDEERVMEKVKKLLGVEQIIKNRVSRGAQIITDHLF